MLNLNIQDTKKYMLKDTPIMWLDVETTGIDAYWCDLITACFLVEKAGEIIDTFEMKVQPFLWDKITKGAEAIHGITVLQLQGFDEPTQIFKEKLLPFLQTHFKGKQFILAGHNVAFDRRHLSSYWGKCKSKLEGIGYYSFEMLENLSSLNAWFNINMVDTMLMAKFTQKHKLTNFINPDTNRPSVKLEIICKDFGIEYNSHDATDDIIATKIVGHRLWKRIKNNPIVLIKFQKQYPFMYNMFNENYIKELKDV
jgi:DNA polymerase III epsilon subunit-like protein